MKKAILVVLVLLLILFVGIASFSDRTFTKNISTSVIPSATIFPVLKMQVTSNAFLNNQSLPKEYTCDGKGVNPPLHITDVPTKAKSLVLLMDDPDVPKTIKPDGMFDHWVVYNIDPKVQDIAENSVPGTIGKNTVGTNAYIGACPPDRQHRYFFKLFALDTHLSLSSENATKQGVETAMQGHIIAHAILIGLYERAK